MRRRGWITSERDTSQGRREGWRLRTGALETFGYDNYGNRWVVPSSTTGISLSGLTPTASTMINPATRRLTGSNYLFDAAGNQTFVSPWAMTFDAESRMTGFTSTNNGSGTYTYDGEGRRVLKTVGATTTLYVYDAQGNRAAEYASAVAAPPCATCYETVDTVGSLRAVTDGFGNTIALHDYLPFGEELSTANRSGVPGYGISDGLVDRFTGKERDSETGLDYFGARYLSSTEGRFASADPIHLMPQKLMDPQQWNLYAYVRNNPLTFLDPTGMYLASCGDGVKGCDKQVTKLDSAIQTALKSNNSDVVKAAQAYGRLGDDNGVNVSIVKVVDPKHPDVTGKVTEQAGTGGFTVDPTTGQVKQATQVSIRAGMGSSQLEETAVHEGQHVLDRANFVSSISNGSQFNRLLNITGRQSERNAYGVENEWLGLHGQPARNIDDILSHPPYSDSPTIDVPLFPAVPGAQP